MTPAEKALIDHMIDRFYILRTRDIDFAGSDEAWQRKVLKMEADHSALTSAVLRERCLPAAVEAMEKAWLTKQASRQSGGDRQKANDAWMAAQAAVETEFGEEQLKGATEILWKKNLELGRQLRAEATLTA